MCCEVEKSHKKFQEPIITIAIAAERHLKSVRLAVWNKFNDTLAEALEYSQIELFESKMVPECSLSKDRSELFDSNLQLVQPYIALVVPQRTVEVKSAQQGTALTSFQPLFFNPCSRF